MTSFVIDHPINISYGDVSVVQRERFSSLWNENVGSFTYCAWLTVQSREENKWISIVHHGGGENIRCPGIWLMNMCNQLHVRVDTTKQKNQGIDFSKCELPLNQAVHIAVVANNSTGELSLYINGVEDRKYSIFRHPDEKFIVGRDQPCYIGKDPWHGSSAMVVEDFAIFPRALEAADIITVMMRSRNPGALPPTPLVPLQIPNPKKRLTRINQLPITRRSEQRTPSDVDSLTTWERSEDGEERMNHGRLNVFTKLSLAERKQEAPASIKAPARATVPAPAPAPVVPTTAAVPPNDETETDEFASFTVVCRKSKKRNTPKKG